MVKKLFITVFALSVFMVGSPVLADHLSDGSSLHQKSSLNYQKSLSQGQRRNEPYRQNKAISLRPKNRQVQKNIRLKESNEEGFEGGKPF